MSACTLLARFDDAAPADSSDASATVDSAESEPLGADAAAHADAGPFPDARESQDAREDTTPSDPCEGEANGLYCATDGLNHYQGPTNVLIRCDGGAVATETTCDAGCLALSDPFPDTCNACDSKPNGSYCGRDFSSFPTTDADWLVQCQNSNAVQLVACAHGCLSNGASSSCASP